jgi:hypothetical protein
MMEEKAAVKEKMGIKHAWMYFPYSPLSFIRRHMNMSCSMHDHGPMRQGAAYNGREGPCEAAL